MKPCRVVYMGTPAFAIPALDALHDCEDVEVALVLSQPDRPSGRGKRSTAPPVAARAAALGLPLYQPETLRTPEAVARLAGCHADLFIVAAYGQILRQEVLDLPRHGCINIHASLLPRWRGAAPIHWAVACGDAVTGVSIMRMERGLDTGPVYAMEATMIGAQETTGELHDRLAPMGAALLMRTLPAILEHATPTPQDSGRSTYARMLRTRDRDLDYTRSAREVAWRINGMAPWPGTRIHLADERITLLQARPSDRENEADAPIGTVTHASPDDGLHFVCGDGRLVEVLVLQRPGRKPMAAQDALRGWTPDCSHLIIGHGAQ